jgi:hypothetical protein
MLRFQHLIQSRHCRSETKTVCPVLTFPNFDWLYIWFLLNFFYILNLNKRFSSANVYSSEHPERGHEE